MHQASSSDRPRWRATPSPAPAPAASVRHEGDNLRSSYRQSHAIRHIDGIQPPPSHDLHGLVNAIQQVGRTTIATPPPRQPKKRGYVVAAILLSIITLGSFLAGRQGRSITSVESAYTERVAPNQHDATLSEAPISTDQINNYAVAADYPKYVAIPKLDIGKTRVLRSGVTASGEVEAPPNIWDVGWYDASVVPAQTSGATVIVGHVTGAHGGGTFYNLYRLVAGDIITITTGDNKVYSYTVVDKQPLPVEASSLEPYLSSKDASKPGLTLITITGDYNPTTEQYDDRLAVFAVRSAP